MMLRVLTVFGTRPEALKLIPVVLRLEASAGIEHALCVTGQHREMLRQVLDLLEIRPRFDLNVMVQGQTLSSLTGTVIPAVSKVIEEFRPDRLVVQGDTTTAFCSALAAHYHKVPVAHVEAGLRSGNLHAPWPEEANRRLISVLTDLHFAPTRGARENLLAEGVSLHSVVVTGNTGIDMLFRIRDALAADADLRHACEAAFPFLDTARRLILVTGHRRESFGPGIASVFQALAKLSERNDVQIVFPVHLNPSVQKPANEILGTRKNVVLLQPLDYPQFVYLMQRSALIITDSGGIQEEAPSIGRPVLVTREVTERPEAIEAGAARLVGTSAALLLAEASRLLDDPEAYAAMARPRDLYGDGRAADRIAETISKAHCSLAGAVPETTA